MELDSSLQLRSFQMQKSSRSLPKQAMYWLRALGNLETVDCMNCNVVKLPI